MKICEDKGYIELKKLFKVFLFDSNAFIYLHDKNTPFNFAS
jgi:hypothetical protein